MREEHVKMGQRLRELRLERGLPQGETARRLGISAAYLSLIEKGNRSVQLPMLWKAIEVYGITMEQFMESLGEAHVDDGLRKLLDEPLLRSLNLREEDVAGLSAEPKVVTTIAALFNLYKTTRSQLDHVTRGLAELDKPGALGDSNPEATRFELSPFDEVTEFLERNDNWFPVLEDRAKAIRDKHELPLRSTSESLVRVLADELGIEVRLVPPRQDSSVVRRWDPATNTLTLSSQMSEQRLKFQLAHTIGLRLLDTEDLHAELLKDEAFHHGETAEVVKIHLANYVAGALLLPYDEFLEEAQRTRYDVDVLAKVFESSYESLAHRLCNLSNPKKRGVPFHFLRVDVAGNISKRYSARGLRFPQQTGSCPKSAAHMALLTPNVITRQYESFPDGTAYFWFAKVVSEPEHGSLARGTVYSIGLGTHADNAKHLAYADDRPFVDPKRMAVPVGPSCRFCERTDCNQRAAASYKFAFKVDAYTKKDNFFSPLVSRDEDAVKS